MNPRTLLICAAVGALAAAPFVAAGRAGADVTDAAFITTLDDAAIPYSSVANAIALGRSVCDALDAGGTHAGEITGIVRGSAGVYDYADAGYIVGAATAAYCPQHMVGINHNEVV